MGRRCLVAALVLIAGFAWSEDPTVYVGSSGARYHRKDCRTLRSVGIALPLSQALARGLTPCSVCRPPEPSAGGLSGPRLYRVDQPALSTSRDADPSAMLPAKVLAVIDGDTIRVEIAVPPVGLRSVETIRLLGIDAPETRGAKSQVTPLARQSSAYSEARLLGRQILLAFDSNLRDRYNRLLAYVYLPDGTCHNADVLQQGYAHAYTAFPFQFLEEFRGLQREAREGQRGLWE